MSVIHGFPHKFPKPKIGDIYQREQQDGRWEYGMIAGVRETRIQVGNGERSEWIAHLSNGWVDFRDIIRSDTSYSTTEDWHPMKGNDLSARIDQLEARIAVLEAGPAPAAPAPRPSRSAG